MNKFIFNILITLTLILGEFGKYHPLLKYGKYLCFIVFLVLIILSNGKINRNSLKTSSPIFPFVMIIALNFIQLFNHSEYAIVESIILMGAILPFTTQAKIKFNPKLIFYLTVISFLLKNGLDFNISITWESFLRSETSTAETNIYPFLFGLFSIFFLYKKEKKLLLLSILLTILTFKRIVILSLVITLLIYLVKLDKRKILPYIFLFGNIFWLFVSYFITTEMFYEISIEYFKLPPGHLTQGRSTVYDLLFDNFKNNIFLNTIFGTGATQSRLILLNANMGISLIHNDVLKIFIEYGLPVFLIFFFTLIKNNKEAAVLSVFLNILFLTDNTLIYAPVIFLYFLLSEKIIENKKLVNKSKLQKVNNE